METKLSFAWSTEGAVPQERLFFTSSNKTQRNKTPKQKMH